MRQLRWTVAWLAVLGCSSNEAESQAPLGVEGESIYVVPASLSELAEETFFDHPWPSDLRKESDGTVRFEGFPNPRHKPILSEYIASMKGVLTGFSPVAAGFVRFTVPLDPASLPSTPKEALDPKASVQLIDIDPGSPEHGARKPVTLAFRRDVGVYYPPNTLAFMPTLGFPLLPNTRYALVVTRAVRGENGGRIGPSADLRQVLGTDAASGPRTAAHDALADAVQEVADAGIAAEDLVHLAVFTTDDPTAETAKIADFVRKSYPAPKIVGDWVAKEQVPGLMDVYEGHYGPSPNFQKGKIPFLAYGDGGALAFDAQGNPEVQDDFNLRFALTVPDAQKCPMPAAGYPIVVYAHGTGGNYRSFIGSKGEGNALAARCIATMGIDQIFHGERPGASSGTPELLFFNVENPVAARANGPQSAIDVVQQARLFTDTKITVPVKDSQGNAVSRTGAEIRFDPTQLAFFGHSQGGLNGPLFLAVDDQAKGGMLSGSGSMIVIALLEKTKPVNVAGLVKSVFLGLSTSEYEELGPLHPAMSLAQTIVDPTDPIHYVPMIANRPRTGFAPKSVMMTEGVSADGSGDSYAPPHGIEVQAVALGLSPQQPVIHPIAELAWSDREPVTIPAAGLSGNLAHGEASGILAQWEAKDASDGHFVIYDIPAAMKQATGFVRNVFDTPNGLVPAP
jgi:hypothetical protein